MNRNRNPFAPTGFGPDDIEVQVSELLVATADQSDAELDQSIGEVLKLLRERMGMDVVFVSEFVDGQRVFRKVSQAPGVDLLAEGQGEPLEQSWCKRVVDGRLPQYIADTRQDRCSGTSRFPLAPTSARPWCWPMARSLARCAASVSSPAVGPAPTISRA
jgi:hypothetical protein